MKGKTKETPEMKGKLNTKRNMAPLKYHISQFSNVPKN